MDIKKGIAALSRPESYGPTVAGGVAGVFGSVYGLNFLKTQTAQYGDIATWGVPIGWAAASIMGMAMVKTGGPINTAIHTALMTSAVTAGVVVLAKLLGQPYPVPVGGIGGVARGGVRVVGRPAGTPTFAQAPAPAPKADVIQAF